MEYAIGIDLGGTNIKAVAVTKEGKLLFQGRKPTDDESVAWGEQIRELIGEISLEQKSEASWVGLAAPGLAAPDGRSIAWMQGRLDAIQGLDWTDYLNASKPIPILNDAHAALLGEIGQGAAKGCRNVILLTLGTGVGGGAVVDGHLLRGHLGRAGHLGHISLNPNGELDIVGTPGSLEDAIGECTLLQRADGRFFSTDALVKAHLGGDKEASAIWLTSVKQLACGLVSLINVLDPEVVILGGGITKAGVALFEPLQEFLEAYEWRPTGRRVVLRAATLGEWAGAYGAAYHAMGESVGRRGKV